MAYNVHSKQRNIEKGEEQFSELKISISLQHALKPGEALNLKKY